MDKARQKNRLEARLAKLHILRQEFPEGATHQNILDLIEELRREIRALKQQE